MNQGWQRLRSRLSTFVVASPEPRTESERHEQGSRSDRRRRGSGVTASGESLDPRSGQFHASEIHVVHILGDACIAAQDSVAHEPVSLPQLSNCSRAGFLSVEVDPASPGRFAVEHSQAIGHGTGCAALTRLELCAPLSCSQRVAPGLTADDVGVSRAGASPESESEGRSAFRIDSATSTRCGRGPPSWTSLWPRRPSRQREAATPGIRGSLTRKPSHRGRL